MAAPDHKPEDALKQLARALAPHLLDEFRKLIEREKAPLDFDYGRATCDEFVTALGDHVLARAALLFALLDQHDLVNSVQLADALGVTPRELSGHLTTPIKRRARALGLPLPFDGGLGDRPDGGIANPPRTLVPGRTHWRDRDGIAARMLNAIKAEQHRRLHGGDPAATSQADSTTVLPERHRPVPTVALAARVRGCLLGGAVGDALGAPIEFDALAAIRDRYGAEGLTDYDVAYERVGAITDDTQMTLFTAEGLVRATIRASMKGIWPDYASVVDHGYARWLRTQGATSQRWDSDASPDGWLVALDELHHRRAPGNTCLSALTAPHAGTIGQPLNNSKGCGGVMRSAPVGLMVASPHAFQVGCEIAALTHGHPSGYLTAGVLADLIAAIAQDELPVDVALDRTRGRLIRHRGHDETVAALDAAMRLAASGEPPSPEIVQSLGAGWVAEEALAIAIYCALVAESFEHGVLLAVNHSGDSDSTGAITGNLLGAIYGPKPIPNIWLENLELRDEIEQLASDWTEITTTDIDWEDSAQADPWWARYPGW